MLSRKEQSNTPTMLPEQWTKKVCDLLNEVYADQCKKTGKSFEVHGMTYTDEFLFITSLINLDQPKAMPVTYFISKDLEKDTEAEKLLDDLVDSIGSFYDVYFNTTDWSDYQAEWLEAEFKGHKFFYKISRENVGLHIIADNLLNQ